MPWQFKREYEVQKGLVSILMRSTELPADSPGWRP